MALEKDKVILVNEHNEWLGTMDKIAAHKEGRLHRALSVFVMNDNNELLIQQRAEEKYHSGGLWSNTCCSHPANGESSMAAAHRRLEEELGFDCVLQPAFTLRYHAVMDNGLVENEYDHIYHGTYSGIIKPEPAEVRDYRFIALDELEKQMKDKPGQFTAWLQLALPKFIAYLKASREPFTA